MYQKSKEEEKYYQSSKLFKKNFICTIISFGSFMLSIGLAAITTRLEFFLLLFVGTACSIIVSPTAIPKIIHTVGTFLYNAIPFYIFNLIGLLIGLAIGIQTAIMFPWIICTITMVNAYKQKQEAKSLLTSNSIPLPEKDYSKTQLVTTIASVVGIIVAFYLSIIIGIIIDLNPIYSKADKQLLDIYDFEEVYDGYSIVAKGTDLFGTVVIPETFNNSPITSISKNAFVDCKDLEKIIIPESVTYIGENAFKGCESLLSVDFSSNISFIGEGAFADCSNLTEVHLPEALAEIEKVDFFGSGAFEGCESLKKVYVNANLEKIPYRTFGNCIALEEIHIESGLKEIGIYAFAYAQKVRNIIFSGTIEDWNSIIVEETAFPNIYDITVKCSDGEVSLSPN